MHVYDAWGDLRFEGYDSVTGLIYSLVVAFSVMARGFAADGLFVELAQLLCALSVCKYPSELLHIVVNRLDLVLPGEDTNLSEGRPSGDDPELTRPERKWWRAPLAHERPRMIYHERHAQTFRGPVFCEDNVRVSARTAQLALLTDPKGGYRVTLAGGRGGPAGSRFLGETLSLDLPERALVPVIRGAARALTCLSAQENQFRETRRRGTQRPGAAPSGKGYHDHGSTTVGGATAPTQGDPTRHVSCLARHNFDQEEISSPEDSSLEDPANGGGIPDIGILHVERRADLCEFIWRRLSITDEDTACRRPPGFLQARRHLHIKRADDALIKFERWVRNTSPPLKLTSTSRLLRDIRKHLIKIEAASGGESIQALFLVALPSEIGQIDAKSTSPWIPGIISPMVPRLISESTSVEVYTARIAIDTRADFLIAVSRATPAEFTSRTIRVENSLMSKEEAHSKGAEALQARLEGEAGVAKRSAEKLAVKAQTAINNSRDSRVAIATAVAILARLRASQRIAAGFLNSMARTVAMAALPQLRILVTEIGVMHLRLVPTSDHNFVMSWSESGEYDEPLPAAPGLEEGAWCWWDHDCQPQFIVKHAVTIPVLTLPARSGQRQRPFFGGDLHLFDGDICHRSYQLLRLLVRRY